MKAAVKIEDRQEARRRSITLKRCLNVIALTSTARKEPTENKSQIGKREPIK